MVWVKILLNYEGLYDVSSYIIVIVNIISCQFLSWKAQFLEEQFTLLMKSETKGCMQTCYRRWLDRRLWVELCHIDKVIKCKGIFWLLKLQINILWVIMRPKLMQVLASVDFCSCFPWGESVAHSKSTCSWKQWWTHLGPSLPVPLYTAEPHPPHISHWRNG